jgi:phosphatidylglycerophosphate synthase
LSGVAIEVNAGCERLRMPTITQRYRPLTEGERRTVEALVELRRAGYRPGAWVRFVDGSLERSRTTRRERPLLARQGRRWGAFGGAAWILAWRCGRGRRDFQVPLVPGLVWWGLVWQMLDWHLGMVEGVDGAARDGLSPADAVTLCRFWLVPALPSLARSASGLPVAIAIGGSTDWLDGALAQRRGPTRLGRDLDTTADLAFLTAAVVSARAAGRLTRLGFCALAARQGIGLASALASVFGRARRPAIRARRWGAVLRIGGLALCAGGRGRTGTVVLVAGSLVPTRARAAARPSRRSAGGLEPFAAPAGRMLSG